MSLARTDPKFDVAKFERLLGFPLVRGSALYVVVRHMVVHHAVTSRNTNSVMFAWLHDSQMRFLQDWSKDTIRRIQKALRSLTIMIDGITPENMVTFLRHAIRPAPTQREEGDAIHFFREYAGYGTVRKWRQDRTEYENFCTGMDLEDAAREVVRCERTNEILQDFMCKDVAGMVVEYTKQ